MGKTTMSDDKVKIDPMDYYFGDLNKFPTMSQSALDDKLYLMHSNMTAFINFLANRPEAWPIYVDEWQNVMRSGKRVHKMSSRTGRTQYENAQISNHISKNMRQVVIGSLQELIPDPDRRRKNEQLIAECQFHMALHYAVQERYRAITSASDYRYAVNYLDSRKMAIIELSNEIASANLKLVIKFAKEYQHVGVPLSDLIQEGNIGLMRAIEKFDTSKGLKFTTYAVWWIKQGFLKVIKQNNRLIRIPTHIQETLSRIAKVREAHIEETGSEPLLVVVAEQEGMTEEELETLYNVCMEPISIETVVTGEQNKQLKDFIPDTTVDLEADLDAHCLNEEIKKALDAYLTETEKSVMIHRYGLFGQTVHTLEEIATLMDKSRERIRQLESSAKKKLEKLATGLKGYV